MSAQLTPAPVRSVSPVPFAKAPWILLAITPIVGAVLMEGAEALTMLGIAPDMPGAVGGAIYLTLVAVFPAAVITTGVRAIRRHARGLPWIPTAVGILMGIAWLVSVISLAFLA